MSDREKFPAGSVVKRRSESPVWRGVAGKVLYDAGIDRYVLVQWANRSHPGEEDACDLTLLMEPPRDTDSAERSERVSGEQGQFPVGARVRERCVPFRHGLVVISYGDPGDVWVRWDGQRIPEPVDLGQMEVIAPPPAPARTLAPGVESRADVQGGKPVLAGTRTPTDVVNGWRDWADFSPHFPHVTEAEYEHAVLFESGIAWGRERRRRRKEKRAVKRYERVKALAEGESS